MSRLCTGATGQLNSKNSHGFRYESSWGTGGNQLYYEMCSVSISTHFAHPRGVSTLAVGHTRPVCRILLFIPPLILCRSFAFICANARPYTAVGVCAGVTGTVEKGV